MLKNPSSFVLARSDRQRTYLPYASGRRIAAALLAVFLNILLARHGRLSPHVSAKAL